MSPESIGAIFTGLVTLIGALTAAFAKRSQRLGGEMRDLRREVRELREQQRLADRYIGQLIRVLDLRGLDVPPPPAGLFDDVPCFTAGAAGDEAAPPGRARGAHRSAP